MTERHLATITEAPSAVSVSRNEYQTMREQAADLIASGYLPKAIDKPEKAVAIIMLGRELGMGPWQSFTSIDVIQGRPTLKPIGMAALVNRFVESRGGYLRVVESTATICTVEYHRPPSPESRRVSFTVDEAKAAGLMSKETWKQYTTDMLRSRAISRACREGFSDVILGLYTDEEVGSIGDAPRPVQRVTQPVHAIHPQPTEHVDTDTGEIIDAKTRPVDEDREKARRHYFAVANEYGFTDAGNKVFALAHFPMRENGATTSRTQLTAQEVSDLARMIEQYVTAGHIDEGNVLTPSPEVEFANAIADATDQTRLAQIAAHLKEGGIAAPWLKKMWAYQNKRVPALAETQPALVSAPGTAGSDRYTS